MRWSRDPLLWLLPLLLVLLFGMPVLRPLFAAAFPSTTPPIYPDDSFLALFLFHTEYVVVSSLAAALIGVGLGIVATRQWGTEFRPLLEALATIGQTFPPVAVLALAVPAFGYGPAPTMIALTLYGILPILKNTLAGLGSVPPAVREAGEAMGLTRAQLLRDVELPLAAPTILAGVRISVIINIGTAAIGSTVGAITLGNPIIGGLVTGKVGYVLQGALVVGICAIATDLIFERLDRRLRRFATRD
ncbi:MAG TPA: ABC transporter permease [Stellaceae bacterium]|jgi:osmoprotectant transport system permease protein|nr:ABC transporter permease [Stellaceae bacterium]